jgi:DNA-binding response OmpR family regulator
MLPYYDGLSILKFARRSDLRTPVLLLTARDSVEDRVTGLDAGADDYLVKPFSFEELLARVRALLRRPLESKDTVLTLADLMVDTVSHTVMRSGKTIPLTAKEYAVLEYLLRNKGKLVTRDQIADHVWGYDFDANSNVIDVYIRYLRRKIDDPFSLKLIHTVRGVGYILDDKQENI